MTDCQWLGGVPYRYLRNYKLFQRALRLLEVKQEPCDWGELAAGRTSEQLRLLRWLREYYLAVTGGSDDGSNHHAGKPPATSPPTGHSLGCCSAMMPRPACVVVRSAAGVVNYRTLGEC